MLPGPRGDTGGVPNQDLKNIDLWRGEKKHSWDGSITRGLLLHYVPNQDPKTNLD